MATPKGKKHANPMQTRNGKTRLGPLNIKQLTELLGKTQQKKTQRKIKNQIARKTLAV